ncbi:hypothetical protein HANVADRAFT_2528 [Hanseniaspora valbyensis NRRL Y-1626]|uniref:Uncharacterized protein n=1 Tax=Hanseniaspora valbyensis NRRL Y-1626 TaxID=766949 RepID=A0A1B7TD74_9ASCO|nr:hypothetical protein HANVADRAFT_2528 [Hanseniaspora valbyensis NRRL Y-1626]
MWAGASNSTSNVNTLNPNFANTPNYDQHSFYSQGINSAIQSRKNKARKIGVEGYDDIMIGDDVVGDGSSFMNQPIETPLDATANPGLHSPVPMEDVDLEFQEYMMAQTSSNNDFNDDKMFHTKIILKKDP